MQIYREFARFYARGFWPEYSRRMAGLLPVVLKRLDLRPESLLDVACGEGTFAVTVARAGIKITGIDFSPDMLAIARARASREGVAVVFSRQDMRLFKCDTAFDLATCWYDSLNYLLKIEELVRTFANIFRALKPGGYFIFDMNTIYGLAVDWQRYPWYVEIDTGEMFQAIRPAYDFERNIVTLNLTGFLKEGELWRRMDEVHEERGYSLAEIRRAFRKTGFKELTCTTDLAEDRPPDRWSERVWFILRKPPVA